MNKLVFGKDFKQEKVKKILKNKQPEIKFAVPAGVVPLDFKVCPKCKRLIGKGIFNISKIFPQMCRGDRERFGRIATTKMVIGGFIEIQ